MEQKIFDLLLQEEEISWKSLLYEIVEAEGMDPWNINISSLTKKYIELVKEMKEHDLRISGKVLLAAAILLKIKSSHFVDTDISNLDRLINQTSEEKIEEEFFEELNENGGDQRNREKFKLIPRNPQPRNRKVSIHDLVQALQRAMASKKRILSQQKPVSFAVPKKIDIMEAIRDIYHKITYYSNKDNEKKISFIRLLPPHAGKQEKVYTFVPVLHLENLHRVETEQKEPFAEIYLSLTKKTNQKVY